MSITPEQTPDTTRESEKPASIRAVAYYRHSVLGGQEVSFAYQRSQVRAWADKNGVEIIQEFVDEGESGQDPKNRPAFNEMLEHWVKLRNDFQYVLCLDFSRWGRFANMDCSAYFCAICHEYDKPVIFTGMSRRQLRGEVFGESSPNCD